MIVRWYHCVITSYDPPIHLTYQLSFSANRVTLCCKSFTTFVVWRNSYGALCGWVVASARCQQSKAHAPLTSLQIEISSPSLPTLLPQGWHSNFCQLINQSTYNTTYTNNTRSIVYHSPRMQHHLTASTLSWFNKGNTPAQLEGLESTATHTSPVERGPCRYFLLRLWDVQCPRPSLLRWGPGCAARLWVSHWHFCCGPKKAYVLNVKKT